MINYIITKYYYLKYLWTIKKSIGSLNAIAQIEAGPHNLIKAHKLAKIEAQRIRTGKPTNLATVSVIKGGNEWN